MKSQSLDLEALDRPHDASAVPPSNGPPFRADYHVHTKWCNHAAGEMREYVRAALAHGLTEIGFAEHMPITIPLEEKLYLSRDEVPLFADEAHRLQDEYAGRINILIGAECDFAPGQEAEIEAVIAACPFDYVYGAIHFIDGWSHDNPSYQDRWRQADVAAVYRRYYALLEQAARSGFYDIIAHFDLVKKFGHQPHEDVCEAEADAAHAVARAGMTVEINTAGYDVPAAEQYPSARILRLLRERNVPICFGSDAHRPEHVARHFDKARGLARSLGWTALAAYRARQRFERPL